MGNKEDRDVRFKQAVERNFDESAGIYDAFEDKHHIFEDLTRRLCELTGPENPGRLLDVGCGTGISTLALHKAFKRAPVIYGIDISESMLTRARERCKGIPDVYFVRGDAEKLANYFNGNFDAVFYTASIFLFPGYAQSILQACRLIVPGGVLAISFYTGLFDHLQKDAVSGAFPDLKYNYGVVSFPDLLHCISSQEDFRSTEVDYHFEINRDFLFDFLSIPAQSAGLFPKLPYRQRIPLVRDFSDQLTRKVSPLFMGWKFVLSRRKQA